MTLFLCRIHFVLLDWADRWPRRRRARGEAGQATAEYALVLLGAALVGLLVVGWATAGGGAGKIGRLLDRVFDAITQRVT
jgi:hypothetical protein